MENLSAVWEPGPGEPVLETGGVHVWRIELDRHSRDIERLRACLDSGELARARRFHFPRHQTRYATAHGALRCLLSRYVDRPPKEIQFRHNEYGKPFLADGSVQFNLTHSHELALVAVTGDRRIGVDVEWIRQDVAYEQIAKRFFSPIEAERLNLHPESDRLTAFFHCWTRKEAWIKAKGKGLSIPLDRFHVSVDPQLEDVALAVDEDDEAGTPWTLRRLAPDCGYASAVAVEGLEMNLELWDFAAPSGVW